MSLVPNWVVRHWRGEFGLAFSFWVNVVALRLALYLAQEWLSPEKGQDWSERSLAFIAWAVFAHVLVFIWQAVGLIRSAENHFKLTGSQASSWGAQLALVPLLFLNASYLLQAWQQSRPTIIEEDISNMMERQREQNYTLKIVPGMRAIELTGLIELGISRKIAGMFEQGFPARLLILESQGGNIYEARALAKLLSERGMNTHVPATCSSACTAAFIGGTKRTMASGARLGFHQYAIEGKVAIINVDPREEQEKDKILFLRQGVEQEFVDRMFDQPSSSMWFPDPGELVEANVVHEVLGTAANTAPATRP